MKKRFWLTPDKTKWCVDVTSLEMAELDCKKLERLLEEYIECSKSNIETMKVLLLYCLKKHKILSECRLEQSANVYEKVCNKLIHLLNL